MLTFYNIGCVILSFYYIHAYLYVYVFASEYHVFLEVFESNYSPKYFYS